MNQPVGSIIFKLMPRSPLHGVPPLYPHSQT